MSSTGLSSMHVTYVAHANQECHEVVMPSTERTHSRGDGSIRQRDVSHWLSRHAQAG
jgi:hypothetical protein